MIRTPKRRRTLRDFAEAFLTLRKQGKAEKSAGAPEDGEAEFPEAVSGWMQAHQVFTLKEFREYVDARKDVLRRLEGLGKEISRMDTALKHIHQHETLRPVYEKSRKGFTRTREKFAEAHREELSAFSKAARYLKANHLTANDFARLKEERKKLKAEREKLIGQLRSRTAPCRMIPA